MKEIIQGKALVPGRATGLVSWSAQPLSFWGGYDPARGMVTDVHHDLYGECLAGRVLVYPAGSGSSTGSTILTESVRLSTHPVAIISVEPEAIIVQGAVVAEEMYGCVVPVVSVTAGDYSRMRGAVVATVHEDGTVECEFPSEGEVLSVYG